MIPFPVDFEQKVTADNFLRKELLEALNTVPPVSVRIHPIKNSSSVVSESDVPWCKNGFFLHERPLFTLDPLFHAGAYYPQEAGSMALDAVLRQLPVSNSPKVLDLCAAPGGKSTLIASWLNGAGMLVSNEVIQSRAKILRENTTKWGYHNCIVTNNDPEHFSVLSDFFDVIVVDAPCSGEGMFRKDPDARSEWSENNVQLCAARQKRIVMDIWDSLKEGGFLIYSTCTFNSAENEDNVQWFLNELKGEIQHYKVELPLVPDRNGTGYYGIPGKTKTEGFYITVFEKHSGNQVKIKNNRNSQLKKLKDTSELSVYSETQGIDFFAWNDKVLAFPSEFTEDFLLIQSILRIVKMGTLVGESARKGLIPDHELIMNPLLRVINEKAELDISQALEYLKGNTFTLTGIPNGFVAVSYQNEALGWIKNIGNRFNNLYPKEWRIRMDIK